MKIITQQLLTETSEKAKTNKRLRMNYNFHDSLDEPIHRMLNALEPGTYVRPHKHENPAKEEVFILLKGKLVVFLFDDAGNSTDKIELSQASGNIGVEIPSGRWHTIFVAESGTVVYEVKAGPYKPLQESDFAPWSPKEEETEKANSFLAKLHTLLSML